MLRHTILKRTLRMAMAASLIVCLPRLVFSQTTTTPHAATASAGPSRGGDPWPRTTTRQGGEISIYQPQVQSWNGNLLDAFAAVTIKTPGSGATNYGVI